MKAIFYNDSEFSLGHFLTTHDFLSEPSVNDYPVLVIVWNLLLVIVPWLLAGGFYRYYQKTKFKTWLQKILASLLAFVWLLFLPNAAYIITDVRHVADVCPANSLHNICLSNASLIMFFFVYAIFGWLAFVYLLRQVHFVAAKIWNKRLATWLANGLIPLIALGVLLGLLNRWNSWEFFTTPVALFKTVLLYITNFDYFVNWLLFSLFLFILNWLGQLVFKEFKKINQPF